jgi:folate-binding Fe-S cluster repair protein YgfZ
MLFDAFIHRHSGDSFLIDHQKRCTNPLTAHFKRHILRSKVKLQDLSADYCLFQAWNPSAPFELSDTMLERLHGAADGRTRPMGYRFLRPASASPVDLEQDVQAVSEDYYKMHRIRMGVPEGIEDMAPTSALPLESNLDYMGGSTDISWAIFTAYEHDSRLQEGLLRGSRADRADTPHRRDSEAHRARSPVPTRRAVRPAPLC